MKKIICALLAIAIMLPAVGAFAREFLMGEMDYTQYYPYKENWLNEPSTGFWGTAGSAEKGYNYDEFVNSAWGMAVMADEWTRQKYGDDGDLNEELLKVWEMRGLKKAVYEADNADRKWSVFIPLSAYEKGNEDKVYPVVFNFHGYGVTIMLAETYGYAELGGTEDFITVCPTDSTMVEEIMQLLRAEYPIDESRIYGSGFSMGGAATLTNALTYPSLFAAIAPTGATLGGIRGGTSDEIWADLAKYRMPVINFAGSTDRPYPLTEDNAADYQKWLDCNGIDFTAVQAGKDYSNSADYLEYNVHADFMSSHTAPYQSDFYFGQYQNAEGQIMIEVVVMDKVPHCTNGSIATLGWEFMSHWSRDLETGELVYTE